MARIAVGVLFVMLSSFGFMAALPTIATLPSVLAGQTNSSGSDLSSVQQASGPSRFTGADPVPDLSLPKAVLSSVDSLVGAGGVIQDSPQNLTLYNSAVSLRLLGTPAPHDMLLSPGRKSLSSDSSWYVQAYTGGSWISLRPASSSFTLLGTNETGTFVIRTMQVSYGTYSATFKIVYRATSAGPLKWNLELDPATSGQYRFSYSWLNISRYQILAPSQFRATFGDANYTFSWGDVPNWLAPESSISSSQFSFFVNLGNLTGGSRIIVDPSIVSDSTSLQATAFTFQRKVFYEPKGGNYFVFYYDGNSPGYRYSHDGVNWSAEQPMPTGWPAFIDAATSLPTVYSANQQVVVAVGGQESSQGYVTASIRYWIGTISGTSITWGSVQTAGNWTRYGGTVGFRYVSTTASSDGHIFFSYNWHATGGSNNICPSGSIEGGVFVASTSGQQWHVNVDCGSGHDNDQDRSIVVPSDSSGDVRVVYQFHVGSQLNLLSNVMYPSSYTLGPADTIEGSSVPDTDEFSAVSDANYVTQIVYRSGTDYNITSAYHVPTGTSWIYAKNILDLTQEYSWPTITVDYSTNYLYVFAADLNHGTVAMRIKPSGETWWDTQVEYPNIGPLLGPSYLGSNLAMASSSNSTNVVLVWTQALTQGHYQVAFASIPLGAGTVWSPYSDPPSPWDGNGVAPYGQYFANLGEYVSPSTGMLTVQQTDLSVTGRSLNLEITRTYTEPYRFPGSNPYPFESYPWAPLGNGWQFNWPWMAANSRPGYIHLWNGEGYRIPAPFWSGLTASYDNHQGEQFRLVRYLNGTITLFLPSGTSYNFDPTHRLVSIADTTGLNYITFSYTNNLISKITDTVGRIFLFCYNGQFLHSINQTLGNSCLNSAGSIRGIVYTNAYPDLTSVNDPAGRITSFTYDSAGWLIKKITYATTGFDTFSYSTFPSGASNIYRVSSQQVNSTRTSSVRKFQYAYTQSLGDQVGNSTVATYDGSSPTPVSYTTYSFSFAGVTWNVSDSGHRLIQGTQQLFDAHGDVQKEVHILTDQSGLGWPPGSYTNYYQYDIWGNQIYSRKTIFQQPTQPYDKGLWYHENFNSYYNDGLPPGFNAFQDTFSQNQGTAPDNVWNATNGAWIVNSGVYNGTETKGAQEKMFSSASIYKADISIQAQVYIGRQINTTDVRIGIFDHYPGTGADKWGLVLHLRGGIGTYLELLDEYNGWLGDNSTQPQAKTPCPMITGDWYTFNMTTRGNAANGWANTPGTSTCVISGTFNSSSPASNGTGFGLYAGGFSALFDNVRVSTVSPTLSLPGFSSSFVQNGAPGPIGLNTWLATPIPPGPGWNTTVNWLPASGWNQAYASQNYGGQPWTNQVANWPDQNAQWIWWNAFANVSVPSNPGTSNPVWFRRVFNLPTSTNINVTITSDDTFVVYADGHKLGQQTFVNGWQSANSYQYNLSAGYHILAINATNPDGPGPAGLLVSVTSVSSSQVLFRSDATAGPPMIDLAGSAQYQNVTSPGTPRFINSSSSANGSASTISVSLSVTMGNMLVAVLGARPGYVRNVTDSLGNVYVKQVSIGPDNNGASIGIWTAVATSTGSDTILGTISQSVPIYLAVSQYSNAGSVSAAYSTHGVSNNPSISSQFLTQKIMVTGIIAFDGTFPVTVQNGIIREQQNLSGGSNEVLVDNGGSVSSTNSVTLHDSVDWEAVSIDILANVPSPPLPLENYYGYTTFGGLNQTRQLYDAPQSPRWLFSTSSYDGFGNVVQTVDLRGNVTSYQYSSTYNKAYLTSETLTLVPGNTQITISYGYNLTLGMRTSIVDPRGYNTTYKYDILGRPIRITYPTGDYANYTYNDIANYADTTNENGWKTRQIYDQLGRLTTTERFLNGSPYSNQTETYNWQDNVVTKGDQLGHVYTYQYDTLGRLTRTTEPNGNFTQILYNDVRGWVKHLDESNLGPSSWTYYSYDRLGRLIDLTEPNYNGSNEAFYFYDEIGNLRQTAFVSSSCSICQPTTYAYDNLNRLTRTTYPDGTIETYSYDSNGNLVLKTDRKGIQISNSYDSINRLTSMTYSTISTPNLYRYDSNGNLLSLSSQNATIYRSYDSRNRLSSETYQVSGNYTVRYNYKGETLSQIVYPDSQLLNYTYDSLGRISNLFKPGGTTYATITYYPTDHVKTITYGNNLWANYTYDSLNRPSSITLTQSGRRGNTQLLSLAYNYNKTGTVALVNGQVNQIAVNEQYNYDPLMRLTNATLTKGSVQTSQSYQYDTYGNALWQKQNGAVTNYSYNSANNELTSESGSSTVTFSYDADGNLSTKNVTTSGVAHWIYTWDGAGQLVKLSNDGGVQGSYAYDGMGRMVVSKESTKIFYAYIGSETLYQVVNGNLNPTDYVYAGGIRIAKLVNGTPLYYHQDSLGSTRVLTDSSGSVTFADDYQPFGLDNGSPTCTGACETYKFTGKPVSQTTGLYYYLHRWYDPSIGRFISPDPRQGKLGNPQSLNLYIYVLDDPTTLSDPSGLDWWNPFTWSQQQQAQAFTIAIVVVAVVAVVATGGIASPIAAAAVGAALSSGTYTLAAGDKATLQGAVTMAALGAALGGGGALVGGGSAVATTGANLAQRVLVNGAIGAGFNGGAYALTQMASGKSLSASGFVGALASGFVGGALGTKGVAVSAGASSLSRWAAGNAVAGVGTYFAGQAVEGKAPTIGGIAESATFGVIGGGIGDSVFGEYRGSVLAGFVGLSQPLYDAMAGYGNFGPWSNLGPLF